MKCCNLYFMSKYSKKLHPQHYEYDFGFLCQPNIQQLNTNKLVFNTNCFKIPMLKNYSR